MATGYSAFTKELRVNCTAIAKPTEIVIPSKGKDNNGVDRFSSNAKVGNLFGTELLRVTKEEAVGNSITTTMKVQSTVALGGKTLQITLNIQNGSKNTFTNGRIQMIESNDPGNSFTGRNQTISKVTVEPGDSTVMTVRGTIYVR